MDRNECIDEGAQEFCEKQREKDRCDAPNVMKNCQKTCGLCTDVSNTYCRYWSKYHFFKIKNNYTWFFNPNKPGLFGTSKAWGGGIKTKRFLIYNIAIFPSKSTKHGLKWKLTSLPICRVFDHLSMLNSLVVRGRRSSLVWSLAFGTTIFENASFFTYIGNMYIKWKLKTI